MAGGVLQFNVASMVADVLQQHGKRLCDIDLASRKAQEASLRRYDATGWLRKMVGVVAAKDLPAEPSEEDFRLGLCSGIILCSALNKVQPGAVPKVVEAPCDTVIIPDGAALSANQHIENVRNFLGAIEEMGIPSFEASDLEKGGKSRRIVNCILALKAYYEWRQCGANGVWKFGGNSKPPSSTKQIMGKNYDLFLNFISRYSSAGEKSLDSSSSEENSLGDLVQDLNEVGASDSLHILVCDLISDKNQEDIPVIVERMLSKLMEEFEHRLANQNEHIRTTSEDKDVSSSNKTMEIETPNITKEESCSEKGFDDGALKDDSSKHEEKSDKGLDHSASECYPLKNEDKHEKDFDHSAPECNPLKNEDKYEKDFDHSASEAQSLKCQVLVENQQRSVKELKNILHSAKEDMEMLRMKYQEEVDGLGKHVKSLAHAASGYQKVLEENRKLYNQVQDLKGNIRVYCRVRPFLPGQANGFSSVEDIAERTITLFVPTKSGKTKKSFTFNKVFGPSASQEQVFADMQPLIRSVLDGYNVCIFAYGQTGSGKTHTMTGPKELTKESLGVNYRALGDLFEISEQRKDTFSYDISVQMMEIYNEQVRDLLVTDGVNKKLEIRNNTTNGINVPNANLVPVSSTSDVINLMNLGHKNRAVGSTAMNDRSSRSHSCLTVHVQGRDLTSGAVLRGCMHLVDLAGSERCDKTEAVGDRLKEAQYINKSLSALGDVISSLAQKQSHVPYRNSKLTQLLQDSLGGQAKTLMFVHISPEPNAIGETISTLKFAERVSTIELGAARANKDSGDAKELKEQIANLKAALARKEAGSSPDRERVRSPGSSPSHSSWSKAEVQSNSSSTSRRHSLDLQDLIMGSPSWLASPGLTEEEQGISDDCVNKVTENKAAKNSGRRRHSLDNGLARSRYENEDSDDLDTTTSDSSEPDYRSQLTVPKSKSMPNVVGSKLRRPSPKTTTKTQEIRSQIPQPTRRLSNGSHSPLHKNGPQPASAAGRRKPAAGK